MGRCVHALQAALRTAGLLLVASGCGAGVAAVVFLPAFAFQFVDEKDPSHVFFFQPEDVDVGKASGDLTGTEERNGKSSNLSGTFDNRNLNFVVQRDGGVEFTGRFLDADRIELKSKEGTIIVCRTDTSNDPVVPCDQKTQ